MIDWNYSICEERSRSIVVWGGDKEAVGKNPNISVDWESYHDKTSERFREKLGKYAADAQTELDGSFRAFYAVDALCDTGLDVITASASRKYGDTVALPTYTIAMPNCYFSALKGVADGRGNLVTSWAVRHNHPELGFCAFAKSVGYGRRDRFPNPVDGPVDETRSDFVLLRSDDDGRTWNRSTHRLSRWAAQYEPAALVHEGDIFILARDELARTSHLQIRVSGGEPVDVRRSSMRQERSVEDAALDYNPVTRRFEAVRSVREEMRVELWSIDPEEWESAEWHFEGTLFARKQDGSDFFNTSDGFHPTGTVVDSEMRVQYIFIYSGHPCGPAGSFMIKRTLDTPALARFFREQGSQKS